MSEQSVNSIEACSKANEELDRLRAERDALKDACKAVDIYFKALAEQWEANDGRVVSDSGTVINAGADCERLCNIAAMKVKKALGHKDGGEGAE